MKEKWEIAYFTLDEQNGSWFVNFLFSDINDQTLSRISHITPVQFYSHSWFAVECFGDEPYKPGLERGRKRMFDDGIHTTTPAEVLKKKKK